METSQSQSANHSDELRQWVRIDRRGVRTTDGRGQRIDDHQDTRPGAPAIPARSSDPGAEPSTERESE